MEKSVAAVTSENVVLKLENSQDALSNEKNEGDHSPDGAETEPERDPDFLEERYRVDRRKLEQMIQGKGAWLSSRVLWSEYNYDRQRGWLVFGV